MRVRIHIEYKNSSAHHIADVESYAEAMKEALEYHKNQHPHIASIIGDIIGIAIIDISTLATFCSLETE